MATKKKRVFEKEFQMTDGKVSLAPEELMIYSHGYDTYSSDNGKKCSVNLFVDSDMDNDELMKYGYKEVGKSTIEQWWKKHKI